MKFFSKKLLGSGFLAMLAALLGAAAFPAFASEAAAAAGAATEAVKAEVHKGDTAWMMVATLLVTFMAVLAWHCSTVAWCARKICCLY
jgi:hypothetical protein